MAGVMALAGVAACQPAKKAAPTLRPSVAIFPSDVLTVPDASQATGKRVNMPMPDCTAFPSDCNELALVNQLDGFDLDPNIALLFDGPIDVSRVNDASVFVQPTAGGAAVGLNRLVWDPGTNVLYGHPKQQLAERTEYRLTITADVNGQTGTSTFTTMSATSVLGQMQQQLDSGDAYTAAGIADKTLKFDTDSDANTAVYGASRFTGSLAPGSAGERTNDITPGPGGATGSEQLFSSITPTDAANIGFGYFEAPKWIDGDVKIPQTPTGSGAPAVTGKHEIGFVVVTPPATCGAMPTGGWPVAIFGPGFTRSKYDIFLASDEMLNQCIAVVAIDPVGHAYGPESTVTVNLLLPPSQPVITAHGRGGDVDRTGNATIDADEGVSTLGQPNPFAAIALRDGLRQTVADNMALVRAIELGLDVDGIAGSELNPNNIEYYGQSFGAIYGTMLVATDPKLQTGAFSVGGGPILEIARLAPGFRNRVGKELKNRQPPIYNGDPANDTSFQESAPLYADPPVTNPAAGAIPIQRAGAFANWLERSGSPEAFAPLVATKNVLYQFAYGDRTVSNPTNATLMRAGNLQAVSSVYRHDQSVPATRGCDPHGFLLDPRIEGRQPGQMQFAEFLKTGTRIDPDAAGPLFEMPIANPSSLETLNHNTADPCPLADIGIP